MKRIGVGLVLSLTLLPGWAWAGGNANFFFAGRDVDEGFWQPTDDHDAVGVDIDFGRDTWPVHVAIGLNYSGDIEKNVERPPAGFGGDLPDGGNAELESTIGEVSVGALWRPKSERRFKPHVGGGLALVFAEKMATAGGLSLTDDDDAVGLYANGGVTWRIGKHFNIGLDARLMTGTDIELFGQKGDADYFQLGLLLGYGW